MIAVGSGYILGKYKLVHKIEPVENHVNNDEDLPTYSYEKKALLSSLGVLIDSNSLLFQALRALR